MNPRSLLFAPFTFFIVPTLLAQADAPPPPPPPVYQAMPAVSAPLAQNQVEPQRVYGPSSDTLIARQSAAGIIEGFRKVYVTDSAPRVVIYVNRTLVDTTS